MCRGPILCVPEWSYHNFWHHIAQKVRRIWQYPFVEQNVLVFLTCVPNISKMHWSLYKILSDLSDTCVEPVFPLSRNVVHARGFTKGFKVILTKICRHCLIRQILTFWAIWHQNFDNFILGHNSILVITRGGHQFLVTDIKVYHVYYTWNTYFCQPYEHGHSAGIFHPKNLPNFQVHRSNLKID